MFDPLAFSANTGLTGEVPACACACACTGSGGGSGSGGGKSSDD